jgi:hypothetical protein
MNDFFFHPDFWELATQRGCFDKLWPGAYNRN